MTYSSSELADYILDVLSLDRQKTKQEDTRKIAEFSKALKMAGSEVKSYRIHRPSAKT
jgi:hypothetical protein